MKKLLLLFVIAFCVITSFAQTSPVADLRIANATTAFGQNISVGSKIINIATGECWKADSAVVSTATLTSKANCFSPVTKVTATLPIVSTGTPNPVISINAATTTTAGSLSAADKIKINNTRTVQNHDSLTNLDEKDYSSLTGKPDLTVYTIKNDSSKYYEKLVNKVTSISSGSTDIQYPSAKLLYDQLATKIGSADISGKKDISDTVNASGYATVHGINGKEPSFSKNTGFNKNFGSTTGTVLEGRTFGTAANNNTGDFEVPLTFGSGLTRTANAVANDLITGKTGGQTVIGGTGVTDKLIYKSTTGTGTPTAIAHQFLGGTNGATIAATILNNGNVGIGTTGPQAKLDVNGFARATSLRSSGRIYSTGSATYDDLGSTAGAILMNFDTGVGYLNARNYTTATNLPIAIGTSLYELGNGNVGIGTTTPTHTLEVNGSLQSATATFTTGKAANTIATGDASGNLSWTAKSSINLSSFNADKLTYNSSNTFSADHDIVDKAYVDAVASGNLPKLPVDAATTGNITLSGASQTIDGFAAIAGSRILVCKQTTASQNGVYMVSTGAWTRATDLDTWAELYKAYVAVIEGYQNGSSFVCTIPSTGTLETTDVTWILYGVPTNITAGTGLSKTGNIMSLNVATGSTLGGIIAGTGITMTGSTASVSTAYRSDSWLPPNDHVAVTLGTANGLSLSTQALSLAAASTSTTGALTSTDWNTFNGKQAALTNSAGLAAALSDETGTGLAVFGTSPTLVTPILGTPTSGNFSTGTFTWPTFNQNTTGNAANVTGIVLGANGGTGIANTGKTITLGGNITTSGAYASTFTMTGTTGVTFPTSGTLMTLGNAESVTGAKTFDKDKILMKGTSTGTTTFSTSNTNVTSYTITFPAATGTVALTSDLAAAGGIYICEPFEIAADGSSGATVALGHTPKNVSGVTVCQNGYPLKYTDQFTVSGTTVTFAKQVYKYDHISVSYTY